MAPALDAIVREQAKAQAISDRAVEHCEASTHKLGSQGQARTVKVIADMQDRIVRLSITARELAGVGTGAAGADTRDVRVVMGVRFRPPELSKLTPEERDVFERLSAKAHGCVPLLEDHVAGETAYTSAAQAMPGMVIEELTSEAAQELRAGREAEWPTDPATDLCAGEQIEARSAATVDAASVVDGDLVPATEPTEPVPTARVLSIASRWR
jgi:hypothetical protein